MCRRNILNEAPLLNVREIVLLGDSDRGNGRKAEGTRMPRT
jgi:hypothetical protein